MKLHNLMLFANDLEEAKRFYTEILPFSFLSISGNSLVLKTDSIELHIFRCEKNAAIGDYSNEARSVFVFETDSIEEKMSELRSKGVRVIHEIAGENSTGKYFAFCDPFGNVHEFIEPVK